MLGSVQAIRPGDVNWMTAGRGIVHSERTGINERGHPHHIHGLQSWVALPKEDEQCEPEFFHHAAKSLPEVKLPGAQLRIIAGEAYGKTAPVKIYSPLFYVEAQLEKGASLLLPQEYSERAVYVIAGEISTGDKIISPLTMAVFASGEVLLVAQSAAHIIMLGGEPFPEPRYIDWNFVSSSKELIERAKHNWLEQRFGTIPGDDKEFIPLPQTPKEGTIL